MVYKQRRLNHKTRQTVLKLELKRKRTEAGARAKKVSSVWDVSQNMSKSMITLKPKKKVRPFEKSNGGESDSSGSSKPGQRIYGLAKHLEDAALDGNSSLYKKNTHDPPESVLKPGLQFGSPLIINRSQVSNVAALTWPDEEDDDGESGQEKYVYDASTEELWIDNLPGEEMYKEAFCGLTRKHFIKIFFVGVILALAISLPFAFSDLTGDEILAIVAAPPDERHAPARPSPALPLPFDKSSLPHGQEITESLDNDALVKIIQEMTHEDLLGDIDTPQGKAFRWIQSNNLDGMNIARIEQRYILAVFYFHFEVEAWNIEYGWLSNKHECTWHGVRCGIDASDAIGRKLSSTNEKLTEIVTGLDLTENNLHGKLPEDLKYMTNLVQLILSKNFIQGQIPAGLFSNFQSMSTLYLDENYLNGQVPDELGHLLLLRNLDLHDNSLRGTIPNAFNILTDLVDVRLQNNEFYGEIPDVFGGTTNLRVFLAGNNEIEGTIPASLADCPQLVALHLHNNELRGSIPEFISAELRQLHLDNNSLEGPIPLFVASSPSVLEELRLENNKLSGEVSSTLGDQTSLTMLQLQGNVLTGSVPDSVCLLKTQPKLKHLAVACAGSGEEIRCDCCDSC
eukprot:CAMPEP_0194260960 /NCGR_PEP_ID=MMETSP0158-20130606/45781_1 /TAXON_ID=33649 /ORGANISM="Thalassionema nitzschioides, Strain L26-B" /LENGTH=623 /DNA_ID=CAMNT_0039001065 /DNA_START=31 /DNA_END=1902 /DNA_ORIENTATION=+